MNPLKFSALAVLALTGLCTAQSVPTQPPENWLPQSIIALRQAASSKTEFSLDHSMLVIASKLDQDNEDLRRVIAGVNAVSIHSFRFPDDWQYDPAVLAETKQEYHSAGWKQVADKHDKYGSPGVTDVWVHWVNNAVSNFAILVARPRDVELISVSGSISPLDLTHLSGHFGIPKIEGGVLVPNDRQDR